MPKQPPLPPPKGDEDPVWGDLFGFVAAAWLPASMADTPTLAPPPQWQQPNTPRKLNTNVCVRAEQEALERPPSARSGLDFAR